VRFARRCPPRWKRSSETSGSRVTWSRLRTDTNPRHFICGAQRN